MDSREPDIEALWSAASADAQGLVPCVTQDLRTRAVLMVAWVSKEALLQSVQSGWATYYSRSRRRLWVKGESSGNKQRLMQVRLDCDGDTLLYMVDAVLPACHQGTDTCFSRRLTKGIWKRDPVELQRTASERMALIEDLDTVMDALPRANTIEHTSDAPERTEAQTPAGPQTAQISQTEDLDSLSLPSITPPSSQSNASLPKVRPDTPAPETFPSEPAEDPGHEGDRLRAQCQKLLGQLEHADPLPLIHESTELLYALAITLNNRGLSLFDAYGALEKRLEVQKSTDES